MILVPADRLPDYPLDRLDALWAALAADNAAQGPLSAWLVRRSHGWEWLNDGPLLPYDPCGMN
jgi:hypothetical protein